MVLERTQSSSGENLEGLGCGLDGAAVTTANAYNGQFQEQAVGSSPSKSGQNSPTPYPILLLIWGRQVLEIASSQRQPRISGSSAAT